MPEVPRSRRYKSCGREGGPRSRGRKRQDSREAVDAGRLGGQEARRLWSENGRWGSLPWGMIKSQVCWWRRVGRDEEVQEVMGLVGGGL